MAASLTNLDPTKIVMLLVASLLGLGDIVHHLFLAGCAPFETVSAQPGNVIGFSIAFRISSSSID